MQAHGFGTGQRLVARHTWKGHLWRAWSVVCVEDSPDGLIEWLPLGTSYIVTTSRGIDEREGRPASERQLMSLATCTWNYTWGTAGVSKLSFIPHDGWASVELTWLPDGTFLHWYVNFQLPPVRTPSGYDTNDLVIDIVIEPDGSWAWKDRTYFEEALRTGLFPEAYSAAIENEAARVLASLADSSGPFDPKWLSSAPRSGWPVPELPEDFDADLRRPPGAVELAASAPRAPTGGS